MMHMPVITASAPVIMPEKNSPVQLVCFWRGGKSPLYNPFSDKRLI